MENANQNLIIVEAEINRLPKHVWECWTNPEHIVKWNFASEDWITSKAENDLRVGGRFSFRMEAKDGSFGFDFGGTYTEVENQKLLVYRLDDNRIVRVEFLPHAEKTLVKEAFEPEQQNAVEMQKTGWQSILDNFKKYTESLG